MKWCIILSIMLGSNSKLLLKHDHYYYHIVNMAMNIFFLLWVGSGSGSYLEKIYTIKFLSTRLILFEHGLLFTLKRPYLCTLSFHKNFLSRYTRIGAIIVIVSCFDAGDWDHHSPVLPKTFNCITVELST